MYLPSSLPLVLCVAFFTVLPLLRVGAQAERGTWSIRAAALDLRDGQDALWLRLGAGEEPLRILLNTRVFSPAIEYRGGAQLAFYGSAADASAEEPPTPLATTVLGSPSSLLLFVPRSEGAGYQAMVIADSDFPFGSFRLVNLSQSTALAELAGRKVTLPPNSGETFAYGQAEADLPVRISAAAGDAAPRLIRQTSWSIVPGQRELVLLLPNPASGLIRLRHFVDSAEEPGAE